MADQRIKGQETEIHVTLNGAPQPALSDIKDFEVAAQFEIKREGYLGEKTDRRDEVFTGVRGRMTLHFDSAAVFDFIQAIIDRAQRREPGTKVVLKSALNFPNGQRRLIIVNNPFFGEMPTNFPSRTEYGAITLDFEAENYTLLAA